MSVTLLSIDLAKNIFQLHGVDERGRPVLSRRISRTKLLQVSSRYTLLPYRDGGLRRSALIGPAGSLQWDITCRSSPGGSSNPS